jgi:hypothetical protein
MEKRRFQLSRRDFLTKASAGAAGLGLAWKLAPVLSLAQVPWDNEEGSILLGEESSPKMSALHTMQGNSIKNESPRIAFDTSGRLWNVWVSEKKDGEHLVLAQFEDNGWKDEIRINEGSSRVIHPQMAATPDGLFIAWAERQGEVWKLFGRRIRDGQPGQIRQLSDRGTVNWRPALAVDKEGGVWVAWESKKGRHFEILAGQVPARGTMEPTVLSRKAGSDCCRPRLACDQLGVVWAVWDQFDGPGGPNIYLASVTADPSEKPLQVSRHPAADIAPDIAVDADNRLWIAWQSNRRGKDQWDIPRWFELRCFEEGQMKQPVGTPPDKNLDKEGTDQSFEFVRVFCAGDGKVIVTGRPSHNFTLQYYHGDKWSPLYRIPKDGWGGRGQFLEGDFDPDGDFWVVRRDIGFNVLQQITGMQGEKKRPKLEASKEASLAAVALVNRQKRKVRWEPLEKLEGIQEPLHHYYGDLHGHTWMSDGVGDVDEYYFYRRDYYDDDFAALTDHDSFVGNGILPSEWELMKEITDHYNEDGRFTTIYSQEWTTARYPKGFGHKNIYHIRKDLPLWDHTEAKADHTRKLNQLCQEWGAFMIPHHIGWTGVDWENMEDCGLHPLVEIISNHGCFEFMGNRPIPHRGGIRGCFVQDGLARGLKFGIMGSSDSHGLIWHHRMAYRRDCNRTGLTCVLAPDLSRESLFEAMKKRRTYATTGIKPRIEFRVNNHLMGEEFTTHEKPSIRVDVMGTHDIKWITIVRNNKDWYEYGGEGYRSFFTVKDEEPPAGESFYYLRVLFEDGNMAWTSPVWVDYQA